jgi:hypothetical protein
MDFAVLAVVGTVTVGDLLILFAAVVILWVVLMRPGVTGWRARFADRLTRVPRGGYRSPPLPVVSA